MLPHLPQFSSSVRGSVQIPGSTILSILAPLSPGMGVPMGEIRGQTVFPAGQTQLPWLQTSFGSQTFPHAPQFSGSVREFTQSTPQVNRPSPTGHQPPSRMISPQTPLTQDSEGPQVLPQPPQFSGSESESTQKEPQNVGFSRVHPPLLVQTPFSQLHPSGHSVSQAPQ